MFHGVFAFFNFFQEGLELSKHGAHKIWNIANYFQYRTLYFSYAFTQVASQQILPMIFLPYKDTIIIFARTTFVILEILNSFLVLRIVIKL